MIVQWWNNESIKQLESSRNEWTMLSRKKIDLRCYYSRCNVNGIIEYKGK